MNKLALIILFTFSINALSSDMDNELKFARNFYEYITKYKLFTGLPNDTHMRTLKNFISDELQSKLEYAKKEQSEFIQKNGNSLKPPWIDGNLFASLQEGIHKFEFGKPVINGEMLVIPVYLEHYRENDRVEWIDVLVLKKQEGVWMVHNIKYCGTWVFSYSGALLSNLPN